MTRTNWRHLTILHLTDLHFGPKHRFNPPLTADGTFAGAPGTVSLHESVLLDLQRSDVAMQRLPAPAKAPTSARLVVALTGDFTEAGAKDQFDKARGFVDAVLRAPAMGYTLSERDIFIVPGNHDLHFADGDVADRWIQYCNFEADHRSKVDGSGYAPVDPRQPGNLSTIVDQEGLIVAQINSCAYIQKDVKSEVNRGHVDTAALIRLDEQLKKISEPTRDRAIKIALIHHHPVVLPMLVDAGKGYDGVVNANPLLTMLAKYRFHAVLHGHKHAPHTFSYDAVCAWNTAAVQPLMVIAGGSAGMGDPAEMPDDPRVTNTYNVVDIKWHPDSYQARIRVETRGLVRHEKEHNTALLPNQWSWQTLRVDDRLISTTRPSTTATSAGMSTRQRTDERDQAFDDQRSKTIDATRRNYAAIEVMPSFGTGQGYEARVWIEGQMDHPKYEAPTRVEWSAGPGHSRQVYECVPATDSSFEARFSYFAPMLIQARLYWKRRKNPSLTYIFAHLPHYDDRGGK